MTVETTTHGPTPTLGQTRVRVAFNPSAGSDVDALKSTVAGLIDQMNDVSRASPDGELRRLCSLAMTAYEEAAMWAVKALTFAK